MKLHNFILKTMVTLCTFITVKVKAINDIPPMSNI